MEISADRLAIIPVDSEQNSSDAFVHHAPECADSPAKLIESAAQKITRWRTDTGLTGRLVADVLCQTRSSRLTITTCPAVLSEQQARSAAVLAASDTDEHPDRRVFAACPIGSIHTPAGQPEQIVLAAAEDEQTIQSIRTALTALSITVRHIYALDATRAARATQQACQTSTSAATPTVVCRIGHHGTSIAAAINSRPVYARHIELGIETLVEAVATMTIEGDSDHVQLTPEHVRACLMRSGIPNSQTIFDEHNTLTGAQVLPAMQPVLQRLSVELKQSMRFGLDETSRASAKLLITGPGASVTNLAQTIASHLGVPLAEHAQDSQPSVTSDAAALQHIDSAMLAPFVLARDAQHARLRSSLTTLWAGSAAACAAVALLTIAAHNDTRQLERQHQTLISTIDSAQTAHDDYAAAFATQQALSAVRSELQAKAASVEPAVILALLSEAAPPQLSLRSVDISATDGSRCYLQGLARADTTDPIQPLHTFIQQLESSPIVKSVTLGTTSRETTAQGPADRFSLTIQLADRPPTLLDNAIAHTLASEGGQP